MPTPSTPSSTDKPSTRKGCLLFIGVFAALVVAGAFMGSMKGSDAPDPDDEVTVSDVTKADTDETYQLAGPARASNFHGQGWLEIPARDVGWLNNRTPFLTAAVHYGDLDFESTCETPRAMIWSSDTEPMDLTFVCGSLLMLDDITGITVTD